MSTDANAALAWPIEVTEFAILGDKLVERKKTTALIRELWARNSDQPPPHWEVLCGTDEPGSVHFTCLQDYDTDRAHYDRAGFYPDPRNTDPVHHDTMYKEPEWHPSVPRPCVGDPRMDPTVLEEGCILPWLVPPFFHGIEDREIVEPTPLTRMDDGDGVWFKEEEGS